MKTRWPYLVSTGLLVATQSCNCGDRPIDFIEDSGVEPIEGSDSGVDPTRAEVVSEFSDGGDGWTIVGDAQSASVTPTYLAASGNPGGTIGANDNHSGGVWYFAAPSRYLGDASSTYGRLLKYDLRTSTAARPFDHFDLVLKGGGLILGYVVGSPRNPGTNTWTSYRIPVQETGWVKIEKYTRPYFNNHFSSGGFVGLSAPTTAEFKGVLANLTGLIIRGEFSLNDDSGYLDNVAFGAAE